MLVIGEKKYLLLSDYSKRVFALVVVKYIITLDN